MRKLIKNYFLWVSDCPNGRALLITLGLFTAVYLFCWVIAKFIFKAELWPLSFYGYLGILFLVFFLLSVVNETVIKRKITVLSLEPDQIALVYYTDPNGGIIFYEKPLWGKFPFSIVKLPDGWAVGMKQKFKGKIHFCLKDRTINNRPVVIPGCIKFRFSGPFKAQDFGNFLPIQLSPEEINLEHEIRKIFLASFSPESENNRHADITDFFLRKIPQRVLLNDILASADFPERLFGNVKKTKIKLGTPRIIFEKTI